MWGLTTVEKSDRRVICVGLRTIEENNRVICVDRVFCFSDFASTEAVLTYFLLVLLCIF